jgi:signal transduction histidine kinase
LTASTVEPVARVGRAHTVTHRPPEHTIPFTLIAVATAFGLLLVPPGRLDYRELTVAALVAAALLGMALLWPVLPRTAALGIPLGYVALAALLRDAAGGATSGFGGLFLLPVLWLAVTAGRRELGAILAAMVVAQLTPLAIVGGSRYPESGWRGAFVLTSVAAITGLMVQRLVHEARQRAVLLQAQADLLTHASAQLADQNERLIELDRMKDEFIAIASHELRTPLTSISGYVEMSLDSTEEPLSPARESYLRVVQRNVERLATLVDHLLFLARADSQRLEHDRHPLDLAGIVNEAAETARPAARAKNLSLDVETEPLPHVLADRSQLLRLVDNLVSNAIKFTPVGGTVRLTACRDGSSAVLEVSDTGIGISPAEQPQLFTRFFRAASAIDNAIPGTGLGLAISQLIAQAHGATIEVRSAPGEGATFRLALPLGTR